MAARKSPEPGVYRTFDLDGQPAFYTVDWHGVRSEDRIVAEDETMEEVIADLSDALWLVRPRGRGAGGARGRQPVLRLL